jgi:hypothetical protein
MQIIRMILESEHGKIVDLVDMIPKGQETFYANCKDDPGERARKIGYGGYLGCNQKSCASNTLLHAL